jgi:predicted NBD/HSP70 family sugar kinase
MGTERGSLRSLRDANRRRVIEALGQRGVASRADLARATGLSRSTVSSVVADLQRAGLVAERPATDGTPQEVGVGRPPVLISLDRSAGGVVGIDFGHSHVAVAVADLSHTVLAERWEQLDIDHAATDGLDAAVRLVEQALADADLPEDRVLGVGMGLPGPIHIPGGTVGSTSILPGWVGVDARAVMSERLGMPVRVENDANLGALAELVFGAGRGLSDFVYIKVSSGIGAGFVVGGRLHRGVGGTAGEIGHTQFSDSGFVCRCGNRGCLETTSAAGPITTAVSAARGERVTVAQVIELARAGDALAQRILADAGRHIGVAVANLCNLLNPQRVIVGGELSAASDVLLAPIVDSLRRHAIPSAAADVDVVAGQFGKRAEVMGALAVVLREPRHELASTVAEAVGERA